MIKCIFCNYETPSLDDLRNHSATCPEHPAVKELKKWKGAIIDASVVNWTLDDQCETDPRHAINKLLCCAQQEALDPLISEEARKLVDRAEQAEAELDRYRKAVEDRK